MGALKVANGSAAKVPPTRSPERAELALAIRRHETAAAKFEAVKRACGDSWRPIAAARQALDRATAAIEAAKADASAYVAATALGSAEAPKLSVREAKLAAEAAADDLEAAQAASKALADQLREAEFAASIADSALARAVARVVRSDPRTAALLAEYRRLVPVVLRMRRTLVCLDNRSMLPVGVKIWPDDLRHELDATRPWQEALAQLRADADAHLPDGDA